MRSGSEMLLRQNEAYLLDKLGQMLLEEFRKGAPDREAVEVIKRVIAEVKKQQKRKRRNGRG